MKRNKYEKALRTLQVELCHLQRWVKERACASSSSSKDATGPAKAARSAR